MSDEREMRYLLTIEVGHDDFVAVGTQMDRGNTDVDAIELGNWGPRIGPGKVVGLLSEVKQR